MFHASAMPNATWVPTQPSPSPEGKGRLSWLDAGRRPSYDGSVGALPLLTGAAPPQSI
jgi:hypothetical protein